MSTHNQPLQWSEFAITRKDWKKVINTKLEEYEEKTYTDLCKNLKTLEQYYQSTTGASVEFCEMLQDKMLEIYLKRFKNKSYRWSGGLRVLNALTKVGSIVFGALSGTILIPTLATVVKKIVENLLQNKSPIDGIGFWNGMAIVGLIVAGFCIIVYIISVLIDQRKYEETWVRHSNTFFQLNLVLIKFLYSSNRWPDDRQQFEEQVFEILSEDISRFKENMNQ